MPAGADLEQSRAIGQTAMNKGEQHVVTLWLQLEGDVATVLPSDGKLARRIEFGDPALHAILFGEVGWPSAWRIVEFTVTPDQLERCAERQAHGPRRQPLAPQFAVDEIGPDAVDRTGQKPLDLQRGGFNQGPVRILLRPCIHRSAP